MRVLGQAALPDEGSLSAAHGDIFAGPDGVANAVAEAMIVPLSTLSMVKRGSFWAWVSVTLRLSGVGNDTLTWVLM